jgi:hypothetical protein
MRLRDHLKTGHSTEDLKQRNLNDMLEDLKLSLRITPIGNGYLCVDDSDACPLAFLGCTFRYSSIWDHLLQHELIDRVKGYDAIIAVSHGHWSSRGTATCPVCRERVYDSNYSDSVFIKHVYNLHTKSERAMHATELGEILQACLSSNLWVYPVRNECQELSKELEGGLIPAATKEAL